MPPEMAAPFLVYLASDDAYWVHGQVFRAAGESIRIMEQPKYGDGMYMPGGWTVEGIQQNFRQVFFGRLEDFGVRKEPYPYYEGLPGPEEK